MNYNNLSLVGSELSILKPQHQCFGHQSAGFLESVSNHIWMSRWSATVRYQLMLTSLISKLLLQTVNF